MQKHMPRLGHAALGWPAAAPGPRMGLLAGQQWPRLWATAWAVGRAPAWASLGSLRWAMCVRYALGRRAPVRAGLLGQLVAAGPFHFRNAFLK